MTKRGQGKASRVAGRERGGTKRTGRTGAKRAAVKAPAKRGGRPLLLPGRPLREWEQFRLRLPDTTAADRFQDLRASLNLRPEVLFQVLVEALPADPAAVDRLRDLDEEHGMKPGELVATLLGLVPGDTLACVLGMAEHQGTTPGMVVSRLVESEWAARGYRWSDGAGNDEGGKGET